MKDLDTGRIAITSQNHGFNVDMDSIPRPGTRTTHVNLYDGTAEGLENRDCVSSASSTTPRRAPGPTSRGTCSPGSPTMMDGTRPEVSVPKRTDIHSILIIGTGPIVIGQACEFDYSGTQACKALREEGFRVILVNSNPATIMTDPEMADATYIEPITVPMLEKIIEAERPDALLPTLGGQTGLNIAIQLAEKGILDRFGRADDRRGPQGHPQGRGPQAVQGGHGEDRDRGAPQRARPFPGGGARRSPRPSGFPLIIRPSFTLGGTGGARRDRPGAVRGHGRAAASTRA